MSAERVAAAVIGAGALDERGLVGVGPDGARSLVPASALGDLDGARLRWSACFPTRAFPTFRRLDPLAQRASLALEAAGAAALAPALRAETALLLGTAFGCLAADLAFADSLASDPSPAVFPYTLPSTCLGELALRHGLRGPTLALVTAPGGEGEALREAALWLAAGEAAAAVVVLGDALPAPALARSGEPASPALAALLLAPAGSGEAAPALPTPSALWDAPRPAAALADALWRAAA